MNIYPYYDCQFWASWFAFYDFMEVEVGLNFTNKEQYDAFKGCQSYGMVYPLEDLCIVCQPPTILEKNNLGLHSDSGLALSYNGFNEIYALNGVVMKKEYIETSADKLLAGTVLKESNVDVRRELLRKIGIDRLFAQLPNKLIDSKGDYQLYSLDIGADLRGCKFLKMKNPSLENVFHLEGVDENVKTVSEALVWRNNGMFENAEILT